MSTEPYSASNQTSAGMFGLSPIPTDGSVEQPSRADEARPEGAAVLARRFAMERLVEWPAQRRPDLFQLSESEKLSIEEALDDVRETHNLWSRGSSLGSSLDKMFMLSLNVVVFIAIAVRFGPGAASVTIAPALLSYIAKVFVVEGFEHSLLMVLAPKLITLLSYAAPIAVALVYAPRPLFSSVLDVVTGVEQATAARLIIFFGCISIAYRISAQVAMSLTRHFGLRRQLRRNARATATFELLHAAASARPDAYPYTQKDPHRSLRDAAYYVRKGLPREAVLARREHATVYRKRCSELARRIENYSYELAVGKEAPDLIADKISRDAIYLSRHTEGQLLEAEGPLEGAPAPRLRNRIIDTMAKFAKAAVIGGMPALVLWLLKFWSIELPDAIRNSALLFAVAWAVASIVAVFDQSLRTIEVASKLLSTFKGEKDGK